MPIYGIEKLQEMKGDLVIIEAAAKYREIDAILNNRNLQFKRFFYVNDTDEYRIKTWRKSGDLEFDLDFVRIMKRAFQGKTVYLYGQPDTMLEKVAEIYELLDFRFGGFLCDYDEIEKSETEKYNVSVIEEVLYEKDPYIVVANDRREKRIQKLEELGMERLKNYNLSNYFYEDSINRSIFDLNLGYTFRHNSTYLGFAVYGKERTDDYKIVTLGGSTTMHNLFETIKSWPEILYEKIKKHNEHVTIYNGGICGYRSAQGLIKLIRDVLLLKPHMVIVYDGVNDLCCEQRDTFSFPYLRQVFDVSIRCSAQEDTFFYGGFSFWDSRKINTGIDIKGKDSFESWLLNIKIMKAASDIEGINFLAFLQPMRDSMKMNQGRDYEYLNCASFWDDKRYKDRAELFREKMFQSKQMGKYQYLYDLSDIFDDHPEVYLDACHVTESGNEMIAEKILNTIRELSAFSEN